MLHCLVRLLAAKMEEEGENIDLGYMVLTDSYFIQWIL